MTDRKDWKKLIYSFTKDDQVFNWGQHDGKTILEVYQENPEYIEWCIKNVSKFKIGKRLQKTFDKCNEQTKE